MDFNGSYKYAAPPQQVWNALMSPEALKAAIPNAESITFQGTSAIEATIHVNAMVFSGSFTGTAQIISATPPSQLVLGIDRSGSYGALKGQATINLAPEGTGTNMTYTAHFDLSGKVSMADNPIGQQAAKTALNSFFKNLESQIK